MNNHLPKVLVVAPNTKARAQGLKNEIRVGWKHNFNDMVWWWGSCMNRMHLKKLIGECKERYGDIEVQERDSDV